jgi:hypothetical protein
MVKIGTRLSVSDCVATFGIASPGRDRSGAHVRCGEIDFAKQYCQPCLRAARDDPNVHSERRDS